MTDEERVWLSHRVMLVLMPYAIAHPEQTVQIAVKAMTLCGLTPEMIADASVELAATQGDSGGTQA